MRPDPLLTNLGRARALANVIVGAGLSVLLLYITLRMLEQRAEPVGILLVGGLTAGLCFGTWRWYRRFRRAGLLPRLNVASSAVHQAIAAYLDHPGDDRPEAVEGARRHSALPLWNDFVGSIALPRDGSLVFFAWDDPGALNRVSDNPHDRRMIHAARAVGTRRFPSVAGLAPVPEAGVRVCPSCHGSGRQPSMPEKMTCECGGLGWVPE